MDVFELQELKSALLEEIKNTFKDKKHPFCLLYTSPSPRDATLSRMPSSA